MHIKSKQTPALKYIISVSKNGTKLSRRVLWHLIDQSKNLRKDVYLQLRADHEGYTKKQIEAAGISVHNMVSCGYTTHLNELLKAMGSKLSFSSVCESPGHYVFLLSKLGYVSGQTKLVVATREELEQIDLRKPGLYSDEHQN